MNVEKVAGHITNWLREYALNSNTKGFVVGVSGGIDSAVTSTLCARTGLPVLCLEMPIHQAQSQVSRAEEHIEQLKTRFDNVDSERVDLTPVFENFIMACPEEDESDQRSLSLANTRARLRMTTLYYFAGLKGMLVAGTGNKVEDFTFGCGQQPFGQIKRQQIDKVSDTGKHKPWQQHRDGERNIRKNVVFSGNIGLCKTLVMLVGKKPNNREVAHEQYQKQKGLYRLKAGQN